VTDPVEDAEALARTAATEALSMGADGVTVTGHRLKELDDHADKEAERAVSRSNSLGFRWFPTKPGGSL